MNQTSLLAQALAKKAVLILAPFAVAGISSAALVNSMDGAFSTVIDTSNNQEWLDFTHTFNTSPNDAIAAFGGDGYRWATQAEVNVFMRSFYDDFYGVPFVPPSGNINDYEQFADADNNYVSRYLRLPGGMAIDLLRGLENLLGSIEFSFSLNTGGFFDDGADDGNQYYFFVGGESGGSVANNFLLPLPPAVADGDLATVFEASSASTNPELGVWLVRDITAVPEPSSLLLSVLGFGSLVFRRSRYALS